MNLRSFIKYCLALLLFWLLLLLYNCRHSYTPRPRGYFRIDFPEKKYTRYSNSECNYSFEYPVYGKVVKSTEPSAEPCWINIEFPVFKGVIYLTYKKIKNNLEKYTEDIRKIAYKHIPKADDIIERPVDLPEKRVYGIIYDIKGNTASSVNFYMTDSVNNFLSGSLYFNVEPNKDSLAPVISFFEADIEHLIATLEWK